MSDVRSSSLSDRILDAARDLLASHGPASMTVRAVAESAGCSTIGVYTRFGDKAGLLDAVVLDAFEDFGRALSAVDDEPDAHARLVDSALAYRQWALTHRSQYSVMFTPAAGGAPRPAIARRLEAVFDAQCDRVRYAQERHILPAGADPVALARHLWATVHGHVLLELHGLIPHATAGPAYADAVAWLLTGLTVSVGTPSGDGSSTFSTP